MKAKVLLVAEIDVGESKNIQADVQIALDNFREAVVPSREFGITFYQATAENLAPFAADSHRGQPGLLIETADTGSGAASRFTHRYPTRCPFCDADLTKPSAIRLAYTVGDGEVNETLSQLDARGLLVDVGGVIANGYHSDTICGACEGSLADQELAD